MSNPIPKNMKEAETRLKVLRQEYVKVRNTNPKRAKAIATEIYALHEWQVANK